MFGIGTKMFINGVNFPKKIIEAIHENKLVVFAGAGVSMGEPAKLDSFFDLAKKIAQGTGLQPHPDEDLDFFLGNLNISEHIIREKAAKFTTVEEDKFTPLHTAIVKLFKDPKYIRIVTTNFDLLFQFAASVIWQESPKIYTAPALPLGHDFEGIVDIHGSRNFPKSIVLTDRDFGRAYLTEGWARRFLVSLFENYTVLFVGYSHNDIVMRYLARSLPDKSLNKRFAMINCDEDKEYWHKLGIEPIIFQKKLPNDFSHLHQSLEKLGEFIHRQPSEWRTIFWNIANIHPEQLNLEDRDHLLSMCNDESKFRYFTQKATNPNWVYWLNDNKTIPDIFSDSSSPELIKICVDWLVENFTDKNPECIFYILSKHGYKIGHYFWNRLTSKISEIEDPKLFIKWIDLIVQIAPYHTCPHSLSWLAEASNKLGLFDCLLKIFELMANSKIKLTPSLYDTSRVSPQLEILSEHWLLNKIREEYFKEYYSNNAVQLLGLCTKLLTERRQLFLNWYTSEEIHDNDSWRRSAIEPHEQDKFPESIDVLIDTAREAIDEMNRRYSKELTSWINYNKNSRSLIIQRLCLYAIIKSKKQSKKKVNWLLEKGLHNSFYRHEAFVLMQENYPKLDIELRLKVIQEIKNHVYPKDENKEEYTSYEHLQWFTWLQTNCRDCEILKREIDFISDKFPDMTPPDHPDLFFVSGIEDYTPQSPWSVKELISRNDDAWFHEIIGFESLNSKEYSPNGLSWAISNAIKENKEWGYSFCNFFVKHIHIGSNLFPVILRAFQEWPEAAGDSNQIISILSNETLQKKYPKELSEILLGAVQKGGVSYLSEITQKLNSIAELIWNSISVSCAPFSNSESDFYSAAINTTEGNLTAYWLSALYYQSKTETNAIFEKYKTILTKFCSSNDPRTIYTIPVICAELNYLFSLDENWCIDTIIPIFLGSNEQRKIHAWHGFLHTSGPSLTVFAALSNIILTTIPKVHEILHVRIERFIELCVAMIFWYINDPNELWIPKLFGIFEEKERQVFAERIRYFLRNMNKDNLNSNWDLWLRSYWQNRINGIPEDLTDLEIQSMLSWLPHLDEKFADGVELAISMRRFNLNPSASFIQLDDLPEKFPEATAKLLVYLLECNPPQFFFYNLDKILQKLKVSEINDKTLHSLNQSLIKSGRDEIV